jgi:hypothetical protein
MRNFCLICCAFLLVSFCAGAQDNTNTESELYQKIKALPGVVAVRATASRGQFKESFTITFEQPVDHQNPTGAKFHQMVYLSHVGFDKPMLLETEGYSARGNSGGGELQQMLQGNIMTVEHRYFGNSMPNPVDWQYLTVKNAADDMHGIVSALKTLYTGKWVATGESKGGQTSLFFKCYYPDDVDATVAFVAPVNVTQEDPRINHFIETVGDAETRQKIKDLQIALFKREDEVLPLVKKYADGRGWTESMGLSEAYEYGVLEYPYYFWQYGVSPSDIPAVDSSAEVLANYYNKVGTMQYYADQGKHRFEAFQYQAFTEIGYYNYDITDFKDYMKTLKNPSNLSICPDGAKIVYNPSTMAFVYHFLQYNANHVIYLYGDLDAWSATQMQLIGRTDAVKLVVAGGHHGSQVSALAPEQQEVFYTKMDSWLGMKLNHPAARGGRRQQ